MTPESLHTSSNGASANGGVRVAAFVPMIRNPYGQLLYRALAAHGVQLAAEPRLEARWLWRHRRRIPLLHFHWDQNFSESVSLRPRLRELRSWIKTARYFSLLALARLLGYRIVWTVHEVLPHEGRSRRRDLLTARVLACSSHALVAHDEETAVRAIKLLLTDRKRISVIPHGSFVGVYPSGRSREAVREDWGLTGSRFVFLAFGNLRRYKQLDLLLEAFARLPDPALSLVIAGEFLFRLPEPDWERQMRSRLKSSVAVDPRIQLRIGRVPDDQVSELHRACDAAVLARSDGWTSGSIILALSEGLPVIAARRAAYVELLDRGKAGWLYEPGDAWSLAQTMEAAAADPLAAEEKGGHARRRATALDWDRAAANTAAIMLSTLPDGGAVRR
jgi:beta-1,4-mannosyltransferase